jgi:hypothetical protein
LKFKAEMCLLLLAIVLFVVSAFFYSYPATTETRSLSSELGSFTYPYRAYAISFVGFGSVLMLVASISYSKRSKNLGHTGHPV